MVVNFMALNYYTTTSSLKTHKVVKAEKVFKFDFKIKL